MHEAKLALESLAAAALLISAFTDLRGRKIRNWVTLPTCALCLALRAGADGWGSLSGPGAASGLFALALAGGLFLLLHLLGAMGMGDVKLAAALGAALGFPTIMATLFWIAVAGGLLALGVMIRERRARTTLPYGVAMALGAFTEYGLRQCGLGLAALL